jgi:hypothetical protein
MQREWKPSPGQVTLIEPTSGADECLTGVVLEGEEGAVVVDLGASPSPDPGSEVVASFFTPQALYRVRATASPQGERAAVIALHVKDVERVQRRESPRARLALPVVLSDFDSSGEPVSVVGETIDVGPGGCRVLTTKPFPAGGDPTVSLQLPGGDTVVALAAILQAQAASGRWSYRLVFTGLEEPDADRLADLAENHPG